MYNTTTLYNLKLIKEYLFNIINKSDYKRKEKKLSKISVKNNMKYMKNNIVIEGQKDRHLYHKTIHSTIHLLINNYKPNQDDALQVTQETLTYLLTTLNELGLFSSIKESYYD